MKHQFASGWLHWRERRWQNISFINVAGCPSIIPCRIGVSHLGRYSHGERPLPGRRRQAAWALVWLVKRRYITTSEANETLAEALCLCTGGTHRSLYRACQESVFTQMVHIHPGPYMNALKAEYKGCVCIEWMNREYMTVSFSQVYVTQGLIKEWKVTDMKHILHTGGGTKVVKFPEVALRALIKFNW